MPKFSEFLAESLPKKVVIHIQHENGKRSRASYPLDDADPSSIQDKIEAIAASHLATAQRFYDLMGGHLQAKGHSRAQKVYQMEVV